MAKVIATDRGYYGKILREPGDTFTVKDGAKASWFELIGGKDKAAPEAIVSDDPGVATPSGTTVKGDDGEEVFIPDNWRDIDWQEQKSLAAKVSPTPVKNKKDVMAALEAATSTKAAPVAEPFGEAPEPERVTNEIAEATGSIQPDWIEPGQKL